MLFSPITADDYMERMRETRRLMAREGLDLLLVFCDSWRSGNCRYLTGIKPSRAMMPVYDPILNRSGYGLEMITIPLEEDPALWITDFEVEWVKRELGTQSIKEEPWIDVRPWEDLTDTLKELGSNAKRIGFDGKNIVPWPVYEGFRHAVGREIQDSEIISILRRVKSRMEIKLMEVASNINDKICEALVDGIVHYGVTEKEVERKIEAIGHSMDAEYVDANFMISRDLAWGHSTDTSIEDGSILSLHVILNYEGYASDNDRVMGYGNISGDDRKLAEICVQSYNNGLAAARPGIKGLEVIEAVKRTHEYAAAMPWTGAHGIGLDGEEGGKIDDWILEEGTAFCLHAGAYHWGTIWETEDVIVVTKRGARTLTRFPRDYVIQ
jgi:Xaa-Pro aminopeptidase